MRLAFLQVTRLGVVLGILCGVCIVAPAPASAQVATTGKGFVLDYAGSVTRVPGEDIAGTSSIKGSYLGAGSYTPYLHTNPLIFPLTADQTYKVTFTYRILATPSDGFEVLFFSRTGAAVGNFLPSTSFTGAAGASGTATLTNRLGPYHDYQAMWTIRGTGSIAVDDIEIDNVTTGQVVALESGEGPTINAGLLNFQVADSQTFLLGPPGQNLYTIRSATVQDLDGDGYPEVILTVTTYPDQLPEKPIIIKSHAGISLATDDFFPAGAPTVRHSPVTLFTDINRDGLPDLVFADAGLDHPPWTGSVIGVGLNMGGGTYRDVSSLIPPALQTTRSYSVAAGDLDGDGRVEIILPSQTDPEQTALLQWTGSGFTVRQPWLDLSLWAYPTRLYQNNWMVPSDFDKDGRQDLLVGGQHMEPNLRMLFGSAAGFTGANLATLPDGPFGHTSNEALNDPRVPLAEGADMGPIVVADFNNDGLPDVFAINEHVFNYKPGVITDTDVPNYADLKANGGAFYGDEAFQVLLNQGSRRFIDNSAASSIRTLGKRFYVGLIARDVNHDGFTDVVGMYGTKPYGIDPGQAWGTTFFLNDGKGAFHVTEGTQLLPLVTASTPTAHEQSLGSFLPTLITDNGIEGVVVETVGGRLNVYKIVSQSSIQPYGKHPVGDFDGDGKTDLTVYRPSNGTWYMLTSSSGFTGGAGYAWGVSTDVPVPGDYDGDGKTDVAVYRPSSGHWFILQSSTNYTTSAAYQWGTAGDLAVPGDYDGDGKTDLAIYRPSNGTWYILTSSSGFTSGVAYAWGAGADVPVPGDYDGDGRADITVYRPSTAYWFVLKSSTNYTAWGTYQWGTSGDVAVPGDYDGDGKTDLAIYRPSNGTWYILTSSTGFTGGAGYAWGVSTDVPVPGDYDGDGKADLAVYRPSTANWFILKSSTNYTTWGTYQWGTTGDMPVLKRP